MDAAVAALVGAALGVAGSIGGAWLTQRQQSRREILSAAVKIGLEEFQSDVAIASKGQGVVHIPPPYSYVAFNAEVLSSMVAGKLTKERLKTLCDRHNAMLDELEKPGAQ